MKEMKHFVASYDIILLFIFTATLKLPEAFLGRIHSCHFESAVSRLDGNAISDKEKITKEQMSKGHFNSSVRVPEDRR